jgi:hypothetical protein
MGMLLGDWPVTYPNGWCKLAGQPQTVAELEATDGCVARGKRYGGKKWVRPAAEQLAPQSTLRAPHRPRKGQLNQ